MEGKSFWLSLDSGAHSWFNHYIQSEGDNSFRGSKNLNFDIVRSRMFKTFLDRYIGYLHEVGSNFRFYVSLDVIGHAKYTWDILKYMESNGLHPIPAFHLNEDFAWLTKIIDNYDYMGIGVINKGEFAAPFQGWIKKVFEQYVQNPDGTPRLKVHGFAANALDILKQYPFYSCDASTWSFGARLGHVQVPNFIIKNNEIAGWDYFPHNIKAIPMTERRFGEHSHYLKLSPLNKKLVDQYFEFLKVDVALVQTEYFERDYVNALFFINAEKELKNYYEEKFSYSQGGNIYLAGTSSSSSNTVPGIYKLVKRLLERENTLKFLLSYWYGHYANSNLVILEYLKSGKLSNEYIEEMNLRRKELAASIDLRQQEFEKMFFERPHLEGLELDEINSSIKTDLEFKKNRVEAPKQQVGFDLQKIKERKAFVIKPRPMSKPAEPIALPPPEITQEIIEEVAEEVLEKILEENVYQEPEDAGEMVSEITDNLQMYLDAMTEEVSTDYTDCYETLNVSASVTISGISLQVMKDIPLNELNSKIKEVLSSLIASNEFKVQSITIEESNP